MKLKIKYGENTNLASRKILDITSLGSIINSYNVLVGFVDNHHQYIQIKIIYKVANIDLIIRINPDCLISLKDYLKEFNDKLYVVNENYIIEPNPSQFKIMEEDKRKFSYSEVISRSISRSKFTFNTRQHWYFRLKTGFIHSDLFCIKIK